jgi:acyl-CoA reductase-like NAD-dependent aldehyde dehydrogenase
VPTAVDGYGPDEIVVTSPYDGEEVGRLRGHSTADVDLAVGAARRTLSEEPLAAWERAKVLDQAAVAILDRADHLAELIVSEAGKPVSAARVEVLRAHDTFMFAAAEARRLTGEMVPLEATAQGAGKLGFTLRVPSGVVAAITPFNFPLNLVAHKVAPALAAGCPVVLKPSEQTPFTALELRRLLVEHCNLPKRYLQVVNGGPAIGQALIAHPDVTVITFTGSREVGWDIRARCPRKKVLLELGNNSPVIIEPDADWQKAAEDIAVAGFSYAGQTCVSVQRVLVHHDVVREFLDALVGRVEQLKVGDPHHDDTDVSAVVSAGARDRIIDWIEEAMLGGAVRCCGGKVEGKMIWPTVLRDVPDDARLWKDEVFGPVVSVRTYAELGEALRLANDTRFGLQAAVYTSRLAVALQAAQCLGFGAVLVNEVPSWRSDLMPYGGLRDSGNTREGPAAAIREMTEERLVVIQP